MITLDNFHLNNKTKNIINTWKLSYKNNKNIKPLFINGVKGCGKTTISNILLNDYSIITIDINTNNIEDYIKLLLGKKDISMLFSNKKFKAIIIDDIFINKKVIKNSNIFINLLLNATNNPIIIINSYKKNKILENICNKCYYIDINFTNKQLYNITMNLLLKKNIILDKNNINNIIKNCNSNLNSINENIIYFSHNYNNNYNVNNYDVNHYNNNNILQLTETLLYNDINLDINNIYLKYNYDINVILYNIIDNIINITLNIDIILNLYHSILYIDNCDYYNYQYNSEIYIFYSLIYSIYKFKNIKLIKKKIEYNKYISYSLQYLSKNNLDPNLYYYFKKCLINYNLTDNKQEYLIKLKEYIIENNLLKKNITSIIRLDITLNNLKKKTIYIFNK